MRPVRAALKAGASLEREEALDVIADAMETLQRRGSNLVAAVLPDGPFATWDHHPPGDVLDRGTGSQWYYHAHPSSGDAGGPQSVEHGHFHLFRRDGEAVTHLIGVSMNALGAPIGLFTTNAWVTGEDWRPADRTAALAEGFEMGEEASCPEAGRWLTALLRLYREEVVTLLHGRDEAIEALRTERGDVDPFEDRNLEVCSTLLIDLRSKADEIDAVRR